MNTAPAIKGLRVPERVGQLLCHRHPFGAGDRLDSKQRLPRLQRGARAGKVEGGK